MIKHCQSLNASSSILKKLHTLILFYTRPIELEIHKKAHHIFYTQIVLFFYKNCVGVLNHVSCRCGCLLENSFFEDDNQVTDIILEVTLTRRFRQFLVERHSTFSVYVGLSGFLYD